MSYIIMIMCEPRDPASSLDAEMINCALKIADGAHCRITAVMPCNKINPGPIHGADLLAVDGSAFMHYSAEAWTKAALAASQKLSPDLVIIPHTSAGYDYAPRVAAILGASCITSVTGVETSEGKPRFRRAGFHGKIEMAYETGEVPLVITVMPGAFSSGETAADYGSVGFMEHDISLESTSHITVTDTSENNPELENAEVIISAGRGTGKQENLELIRSMAALFPKSSIAGSRVLCDNGWIEYRYQVGLTGKKVSPLLYVACGISGSPQHIAGMKDSGTVVSINRDPGAAIFSHSDICIIEELEKFIPVFIETAAIHNQKK
ncbi:MAG TPA: electron transfer flavoprotein subunit alpha/FixB family protein [Spirochaetota bacterium]|nr:electron transfer flavoprotein subunit alpha/FixB family protein [Spirochaetota bacterium]